MQNEFTNQITIIKKEYANIENVLTNRNYKLENLIDELQQKLAQYSIEIEKLRKELASRETQPSESTIQLLLAKENENKRLKELLTNLQQMPDIFEMRKLIDDKHDNVDKINEIISEIKKNKLSKQDLPDMEKDCHAIILDLNKTNDKLNNVIRKIKDFKAASNDNLNNDDLVPKLESLKKQCQDEINMLNRYLKPIDYKPLYLKDKLPQIELPEKSTLIHPADNLSLSPSKVTVSFTPREHLKNIGPVLSTIPSSEVVSIRRPLKNHKHFPLEPCEACNDADFVMPQWKEPSVTVVEPLSYKTSDSTRKLIKDFHPPSPRALSKERRQPHKTKRGCCSKQESDFSNYPYEKKPIENNLSQYQNYGNPYDEKIVKVHSPQNINEHTTTYINPIMQKQDFNPQRGIRYRPPKTK